MCSCVISSTSPSNINKNYFHIIVEPGNVGKITPLSNLAYGFYKIDTFNKVYKRVSIKVKLIVRSSPGVGQVICKTGFGITRFAMWIKDPFAQINELLPIIDLAMIIQILLNIIGALS